jgi:hypothetical protein
MMSPWQNKQALDKGVYPPIVCYFESHPFDISNSKI